MILLFNPQCILFYNYIFFQHYEDMQFCMRKPSGGHVVMEIMQLDSIDCTRTCKFWKATDYRRGHKIRLSTVHLPVPSLGEALLCTRVQYMEENTFYIVWWCAGDRWRSGARKLFGRWFFPPSRCKSRDRDLAFLRSYLYMYIHMLSTVVIQHLRSGLLHNHSVIFVPRGSSLVVRVLCTLQQSTDHSWFLMSIFSRRLEGCWDFFHGDPANI